MRLLIAFRHRKAVEPFLDLVTALLARGHEVIVATHERDEKVPALLAPSAALTFVTLPDRRRDAWAEPAELVRHVLDVVQYLGPAYAGAAKLRRRVFDRLLKMLGVSGETAAAWSAETLLDIGGENARRLESSLRRLEGLTPPDALTTQALDKLRPDAVLVTPLLHFGSTQVELVKAARAARIPVGMLLFSWDNLSTKGALHVAPDHLFVWNARQRREAAELHGFDEGRVSVTGAARFDRFFRLRPQVDRTVFRTTLGVTAETPVVLYLCSSKLVSEKEVNFIRQWRAAIRESSSDALREALVLVRPHPDLPLAEGKWLSPEQLVRWPGFPHEARARALFGDRRTLLLTSDYGAPEMLFESIYQSGAVVGLNTSAEIEAGIVGRPVITVLSDMAFADGQQTTLHFHYLTAPGGGFVQVAATLDQHTAALARALAAPASNPVFDRSLAEFIRPAGWDRPASDVLAEAIEREMRALIAATRPVVAPAARPRPTLSLPPRPDAGASDDHLAMTLAWLGPRLTPGAVIYDLTAGTGRFALAAARQFGATVVAFESNLPALMTLWQGTLAEGCHGLVVPLLLKPGVRSSLQQQRFDRLSADADRLSLRTATWREHDPLPGEGVIQPVMSVPLDWAMRRWKWPLPSAVRAVLTPDDSDLIDAIDGLLGEPRVTTVVLSGDSRQTGIAAARFSARGFAAESVTSGADMVWLARAPASIGAPDTSPQARLQ